MTVSVKTGASTWSATTDGFVKLSNGTWAPITNVYAKLPDGTWQKVGGRYSESGSYQQSYQQSYQVLVSSTPVYQEVARYTAYVQSSWSKTYTGAFSYTQDGTYFQSEQDYYWYGPIQYGYYTYFSDYNGYWWSTSSGNLGDNYYSDGNGNTVYYIIYNQYREGWSRNWTWTGSQDVYETRYREAFQVAWGTFYVWH